jgi:hypothetical protein
MTFFYVCQGFCESFFKNQSLPGKSTERRASGGKFRSEIFDRMPRRKGSFRRGAFSGGKIKVAFVWQMFYIVYAVNFPRGAILPTTNHLFAGFERLAGVRHNPCKSSRRTLKNVRF